MTWAIYCYAQVALSHPLVEGNGRLARAVLACALGHSGILNEPWLPMTAAFYRNAPAIVEALHYFNHDLPKAQSVFAHVILESIHLSESA